MNKKKIINIYMFVIGLIFIISGVVPMLIDNIEYKKIENEVLIINKGLKEYNVNKINLDIDKNITVKNTKLENSIEKYLKKVIFTTTSIMNTINNGKYKDSLSINNIKNNEIDKITNDLEEEKNVLNNYLDEINNIKKDDSKDKIKVLNNIEINNYETLVNDNIDKIEKSRSILNSLKENGNYEIQSDKVIFLKRNDYDNFKNYMDTIQVNNLNMFFYDLTKDLEGPVINANDITIYEGNYYNLNNNISCVDEIDGHINCNIDGNYDKNIVGVYPIKISATDKSGITTEKIIKINVIEKPKLKYYTEIIRNYNTVIVYELDENNEYTKIAKVFSCSTGIGGRTPTGTFYTTKGSTWGPLIGGVWGQYYTVITGNILFHSVPYYSMSKDNLEWEEYNKLGEEASAGCVRLSVIDAKWIYENCPSGMKLKIYDGELPAGVTKPVALKIGENSPFKGWDPTDPDINNPWNN